MASQRYAGGNREKGGVDTFVASDRLVEIPQRDCIGIAARRPGKRLSLARREGPSGRAVAQALDLPANTIAALPPSSKTSLRWEMFLLIAPATSTKFHRNRLPVHRTGSQNSARDHFRP